MKAGVRRTPRLDTADRGFVVVDVVLLLVLGWVLWLVLDVGADQRAAATGGGEQGVIVIDGMRKGHRGTIPVGTFTAADGTRTSGVAWQTEQGHPVVVGDRLQGVRVDGRAWAPGAGPGTGDYVIAGALGTAMLWRSVALARRLQRSTEDLPADLHPG